MGGRLLWVGRLVRWMFGESGRRQRGVCAYVFVCLRRKQYCHNTVYMTILTLHMERMKPYYLWVHLDSCMVLITSN